MGNSISTICVFTSIYKEKSYTKDYNNDNDTDNDNDNINNNDNSNDYDYDYDYDIVNNNVNKNVNNNVNNNINININKQISSYIRRNHIYNYTTSKIIIDLIKNNNNNINYIDKVLQRYPSIMKNVENLNTIQIMYEEVFY